MSAQAALEREGPEGEGSVPTGLPCSELADQGLPFFEPRPEARTGTHPLALYAPAEPRRAFPPPLDYSEPRPGSPPEREMSWLLRL